MYEYKNAVALLNQMSTYDFEKQLTITLENGDWLQSKVEFSVDLSKEKEELKKLSSWFRRELRDLLREEYLTSDSVPPRVVPSFRKVTEHGKGTYHIMSVPLEELDSYLKSLLESLRQDVDGFCIWQNAIQIACKETHITDRTVWRNDEDDIYCTPLLTKLDCERISEALKAMLNDSRVLLGFAIERSQSELERDTTLSSLSLDEQADKKIWRLYTQQESFQRIYLQKLKGILAGDTSLGRSPHIMFSSPRAEGPSEAGVTLSYPVAGLSFKKS